MLARVPADGGKEVRRQGGGGRTKASKPVYFEATGLAVLRRDGFASLAPRDGARPGTLTTRPLAFNGSHLFVNVVLRAGGALRVEVLPPSPRGESRGESRGGAAAAASLCGLGGRDAVPLRGPLDSTSVALPAWRGGVPLHRYAGAAVRFRFHLERGALFAFWVAASAEGKSRGYLAGGSLGDPSIVDV